MRIFLGLPRHALRRLLPSALVGSTLLVAAACGQPAAQLTPSATATFPSSPVADATAAAPPALAPAAQAYLDHALTLLQTHALHRDLVDWPTLRTTTFALAGAAQTPADTYAALRYAVTNLYDGHSQFWSPDEVHQRGLGQAVGYGLEATFPDGRIITVWPDSPAAQARLQVGDRLLTLNGVALADLDQAAVAAALLGPAPSTVLQLTIARVDGAAAVPMTLHAARYSTRRVPTARIVAGVGYLELPGVAGTSQAALRGHGAPGTARGGRTGSVWLDHRSAA